MVTDVRVLQPLNASLPIEVTDSGIVTDVRLVQFLNACSPIEPEMVADISALQL